MRHNRTVVKIVRYVALMLLLVVSIACQHSLSNPSGSATPSATPSLSPTQTVASPRRSLATRSHAAQLVDLHTLKPTIYLDIRYATSRNFMHRKVYAEARCLLRTTVAEQLVQVQGDLEREGLGLKVYDCYRPLSVQKQMWQLVPDDRFVANPAYGSRHNRASAVDVTLVDQMGRELEMPTDFDDFTEQAYGNYSGATPQARKNRQRLKAAMVAHGFIPLKTEWWHFDAPNWQQFPVMDVPLDAVVSRSG